MSQKLTVLLIALLFACSSYAADKPPNIVFIFCDDLTNQATGAYGHKLNLLQTPNIDRLAKEGMLFQRCLVPNSICGPMNYWTLIDRQSDPNEMKNVYNDPAYATTVSELHAELNSFESN